MEKKKFLNRYVFVRNMHKTVQSGDLHHRIGYDIIFL